MAIQVSERAVREIQRAASTRANPPRGLRVGIRGGGCTGFSYMFEWSDQEPRPEDTVLSTARLSFGYGFGSSVLCPLAAGSRGSA